MPLTSSTVALPSLCVSNTDVCEATLHQHIIPVPQSHCNCGTAALVRVLHIAPCVGQLSGIVEDYFLFCAAGISQKAMEPLVPVQRFDSQPHARSTVEVSNMLLQEVMPHDVFG